MGPWLLACWLPVKRWWQLERRWAVVLTGRAGHLAEQVCSQWQLRWQQEIAIQVSSWVWRTTWPPHPWLQPVERPDPLLSGQCLPQY